MYVTIQRVSVFDLIFRRHAERAALMERVAALLESDPRFSNIRIETRAA